MKRTLSLILAALMIASTMTACGSGGTKETEYSAETKVTETNAPATDAPETSAPAPSYNSSLITENGTATAHIVVADGAEQLLEYAAQELTTHIKLVSGAEIAVANTVQEGSLPIIIATPDSLPELEELFPEDLAWLRELGDGEKVRYGDDGFAIRTHEAKIYIFGATARGTLNGVYDFIEDNMGILWTGVDESIYTIFDEQPTITVSKTDYREKSPFDLRTWTYENNVGYAESEVLLSRNKLNAAPIRPYQYDNSYSYDDIGIAPFVTNHNIKWWITNSPSYDPNCREYWSTNPAGEHVAAKESKQVNFWSDLTVQCIADSVIAFIERYKDAADLEYVGINIEDFDSPYVYPEMTQAFEYAPGQVVEPGTLAYLSTVFYTFMNKITRLVNETYPDVKVHTYTYADVIVPPVCEIDERFYITYCPLAEDLHAYPGESGRDLANKQYQYLLEWMKLTPNVQVYNYYGCFAPSPVYERSILERMQSDLQLYAANGFNGLVPEGLEAGSNDTWRMNAMTYWIYAKLAWNPEEDIDSLVKYYCDKAYGDASEYMQEYYRLLKLGWNDARETMATEFNCYMTYNTAYITIWDYFLNIEVDGVNIVEAIKDALSKAYEAANDTQKARMQRMIDVYHNAEEVFLG